MSAPDIAIVGLACRYAGARSPAELWDNVIAQRREFRRIPGERLRLEDYQSDDVACIDSTYVTQAALIDDYEFDRVRFRVSGPSYRAADLTHWLALEVAAQALEDAGFPQGDGLPKQTTGVIIGNTLTGEFTRASSLRLRWPYIRRVVDPLLAEEGWSLEQRLSFLERLEARYKAPFPPPGDETLAGSLSNTIAGRICNHFDLHGAGYSVDGACASSLVSIATACAGLVAGDFEVALAGGVDLSLDPFELVGFARVGALARDAMRVYDVRSNGFWPGEGCGMLVLMRHADAMARGHRVYARIRGWGISSDGTGGLTRPELDGQVLALDRAYGRAEFGIDTIGYFEGHGTGTSVGDAIELQALNAARRGAGSTGRAAIGSIKANIGHTKAAAGAAGLIKATLALHNRVLPPTTGCSEPHPELDDRAEQPSTLRVLDRAEGWPTQHPPRAAVSAMGFGGINAHVILESATARSATPLDLRTRLLTASPQDAEVFLLDGLSSDDLLGRVDALLELAGGLAWSDMADLAAFLERDLRQRPLRAAIVCATPRELEERLRLLRQHLASTGAPSDSSDVRRIDLVNGVFVGSALRAPRIGFLFPGQGSPANVTGGVWRRRFEEVDALYRAADLDTLERDVQSTATAQPSIATASLAGLSVLSRLGIQAVVAVGSSLGELCALHWAGAYDDAALRRIARARGRAMAEVGESDGAMASIAADACQVRTLLDGSAAVIAGLNAPDQTIIAGRLHEVEEVMRRADGAGLHCRRLPVSHAFHSPLVEAATPVLANILTQEPMQPLVRGVVSTVTGSKLRADCDVRDLLCRQVIEPVRFLDAARIACSEVDLLFEVGPGRVLSDIVSSFTTVPVLPTDCGGRSLRPLLQSVATAFALGAPVTTRELFNDRFTRPFELGRRPRFLANPCELAPAADAAIVAAPPRHQPASQEEPTPEVEPHDASDPLELFRRIVAERAELPIATVRDESRLLSDLHLNSITVSQLVIEAAHRLDVAPPPMLNAFADVSVADAAAALGQLPARDAPQPGRSSGPPTGVESWVRAFSVELAESTIADASPAAARAWRWHVPGDPTDGTAARVRATLDSNGTATGVVVCLPPEPGPDDLDRLLEGARLVMAGEGEGAFVLIHSGSGGAAFARTLSLECPSVSTLVLQTPPGDERTAIWVSTEMAAHPGGFVEACYDEVGQRRTPKLRHLPLETETGVTLGPDDVLLVSGGGKGIAAECALAIAVRSGTKLAVLGRSDPRTDTELGNNLERLERAGVTFVYERADVVDRDAVRGAVERIQAALGPVTALIHGAGINLPTPLTRLDSGMLQQTVGPKVDGSRNLLRSLDPDRLRLAVAFGSIIARSGLWGEAHYGLANERMRHVFEQFQAEHTGCRCLVVEWSIWSETGMGARLGSLERLAQQGVTPVSTEAGVSILNQLLSQPTPTSVVVCGRYPALPTLAREAPALPLRRFLERPRLHTPGVELIVEADLSLDSDPYLMDHVLQGERLLPAVLGLEAMAQVAMAVAEASSVPTFEAVGFDRPIVVPAHGSTTIRIAALVRSRNCVDIVVRCSQTAFQVDHMRATCTFAAEALQTPNEQPRGDLPPLGLDPACDLYGRFLFHTGRFQRVRAYRQLRADECLADIRDVGQDRPWFGAYLPADMTLGDAALRDAAIHAIQVCVPHAVIVPTGVDRLWCNTWTMGESAQVWARERDHVGDTYTYDMQIADQDGRVCEIWQGLRLREIAPTRVESRWPAPLLAVYLERRMRQLAPGRLLGVALDLGNGENRRICSDRAIERAAGRPVEISHRPDGKPELCALSDVAVSAAHAANLTLGVAASTRTGCDVEPIVSRPEALWRDLLGPERFALASLIAERSDEDLDTAATRIWTAGESLHKAGGQSDMPIVLGDAGSDGWISLSSGPFRISSHVASVEGCEAQRLALAILVATND